MWFVEEAAVRWQTPVATREIAGHGTDKLIYRKLSSFRQLVGVPEFEPTIFWFRHNSPALGCG